MSQTFAAVVLCAGQGKRMRSSKAKVLHPLLGRPMAYYPVARAVEAGAHRVVAVVGHQGEEVEAALSALFPRTIAFAVQKEQRGTGDAVAAAADALNGFVGPVLIVYGDVPLVTTETLAALLAAHGSNSRGVLSIVTATVPAPHGYGRIVRSPTGAVLRVVEERDATEEQRALTEINAGIYVADSRFLFAALSTLSPANAQNELYLTDIVHRAAEHGPVATVQAPLEELLGVNDRAELAQRAEVLRHRINERHMRAGVTLEHPASTFIDEAVEIGPDTHLGPQVSLKGDCEVGAGVIIEQGAVLVHSTVGDGSHVKAYSVLEDAVVGPHCQVGPFARLRPGTRLDEHVHVGNFVETKKAHLARGTKANHLAYLGDAEVGPDCNIGAGTITCNYDGVSKHQTTIGAGVFIGSDSQLVAPVTIGAGAFVAAGSTITEDVPANALALSRAPQTVKDGWAERRKKVLAGLAGPKVT